MKPYIVRPGREVGDERLYVISPEGAPIGHLDRATGHVEVYKPEDEKVFRSVLAAYLRSSPARRLAPHEKYEWVSSRRPLSESRAAKRRGNRGVRRQPSRSARPKTSSSAKVLLASLGIVLGVWLAQSEGVAVPNDPPREAPPPVEPVAMGDRPTPRRARSQTPLGAPRLEVFAAGAYKFRAIQPSSNTPVTYDPCRPLRYVVNLRTAPTGAKKLTAKAVNLISQASGLQFRFDGKTRERPVDSRRAFQPDRYGDRWAPVLIAWSDPKELEQLKGGYIGTGGSTAVTSASGTSVYVSGMAAVDSPQVARLLGPADGEAQVVAALMREIAHVVGLDRVDDPTQLMYEGSAVAGLQGGDVAGLRAMGAGPCIPLL